MFLALFFVQLITAQNYQTVEDINDACSTLGFSSNEEAEIAVDRILTKIGLFRNFTLQECPNINNAVAKNIENDKGYKFRYILYDNSFFNSINDKADNNWAATSVLAHEIGHHLNGHSLNNEGSNHRFELEADYSSGFYLAKMDATLKEAQSAIQTLKYEKATRTHPAKADRLLAIKRGWNKAKEDSKTKENSVNEENDVPFAVIDNAPTFPGCEGSNTEKRKCLNYTIRKHVGKNFNVVIASDIGIPPVCLKSEVVFDETTNKYIDQCTDWKPLKIIAQFKITKTGDIEIIGVRAPHPLLEKETIRVLNLLPKMSPGKQKGLPVNVRYALPISFRLTD